MEGSRLTPEAICSGLRMIQAGYERQGEDFNIVFAEGEYGKGQHRIEVSFCRLLSEAVELLKEQQPKTGHWLKKMSSCPSAIAMGGSKISACDLCGGWGKKSFQYCPHCGAKMEKQP